MGIDQALLFAEQAETEIEEVEAEADTDAGPGVQFRANG